jgi:DNA-binding transcriptional MerR regulator
VLRHIQQADMDSALWLVNKEQADLHREKAVADQALLLLQDPELSVIGNKKLKDRMSIGEAAAFAGVQASAIRHWEKEGLLSPERDPENGYRIFTPMHIRQILLIRTLRRTVYYLESMKELVQAVEQKSIEKVKKVTQKALLSIHERNRQQYYGIHQLIELCQEIGLTDVGLTE